MSLHKQYDAGDFFFIWAGGAIFNSADIIDEFLWVGIAVLEDFPQ
jgi:hypothetical protein